MRRRLAVSLASMLLDEATGLSGVFGGSASFHGGNRNEPEEKVLRVLGGDARSLHCILDFDRTMTAHDCAQCHDSLGHLDRDDLGRREFGAYLDFSAGGHPGLRGKPVRTWWDEVHGLLVQHGVTRLELNSARDRARMRLRPGVVETLTELRRLAVPTTVVSAGLEHVIVETLAEAGFCQTEIVSALDCDGSHDPWSIRVLANRLQFCADSERVVGCWPNPPIDSASKADLTYDRLRRHFDAHPRAHARRLLVVGDSCGDAHVARQVPAEDRLAIGYFDPSNPWRQRHHFEDAFDVILPHTEDFFWLANALRTMEQPPPMDGARKIDDDDDDDPRRRPGTTDASSTTSSEDA